MSGSFTIILDFSDARMLSHLAVVSKPTHITLKKYVVSLNTSDLRLRTMKEGAVISIEEKKDYAANILKIKNGRDSLRCASIVVGMFGSLTVGLGAMATFLRDADPITGGVVFGIGASILLGGNYLLVKDYRKKYSIELKQTASYEKKERLIAKAKTRDLKEGYRKFPRLGLFNPNNHSTSSVCIAPERKEVKNYEKLEIRIDDLADNNTLTMPLINKF